MTIKIGKNISSLIVQRRLGESTSQLSDIYTRLSSGMRINKASDDAAGLAIASSLNSDSRVFYQGVKNLNDGISMIQIAKGAVEQLREISVRVMELAEQSANGVYSPEQRKALNNEVHELGSEFDRVLGTTEFNGIKLFNNDDVNKISLQVGYDNLDFDFLDPNLVRTFDHSFSLVGSYYSSNAPYNAVAGDFNNDGILDLLHSADRLSIRLGNADTTFGPRLSLFQGSIMWAQAGDLNGDGNLDAVGYSGHYGKLISRTGRGDGTFDSYKSFDGLWNEFQLKDMTGDGILDVVARGDTGNYVKVAIGAGNGTFSSEVTSENGVAHEDLVIGDVNSDGINDIITNTDSEDVVNILIGKGNGSFESRITISVNESGATELVGGDINNDGHLDFLVAGAGGGEVYLGAGDGSFSKTSFFETISKLDSNMAYGVLNDIDGDGNLDFMHLDKPFIDKSYAFYFGDGKGNFSEGESLVELNNSYMAGSPADLNNDSIQDLLVAKFGTNEIEVYLADTSLTNRFSTMNCLTVSASLDALTEAKGILENIAMEMSKIGAIESRLEIAKGQLEVMRETYISAEARIMDADIAEESSRLVINQIRQNVAASILSQANQQPQIALYLLS